jgi:organic hydroperoxide reductase OsmC/OhrA
VSQVATKKKLVLRDERVKVTAHFRESGSVLRGTKEGSCKGFDIELAIESDEATEEIAELIRLAHRMCFTEDALSGTVKLTATHRLNGRPIEVGAGVERSRLG